jgi:tetratricopeptide (TPR) repeat protein
VLKDDNAEVYYKKGQCNVLSKEWKKAVTTLTTAIYLDQGFKHRSMQSRARAYLELNNLTEAKKDIEKLISHDPVSSENYELKGIL